MAIILKLKLALFRNVSLFIMATYSNVPPLPDLSNYLINITEMSAFDAHLQRNSLLKHFSFSSCHTSDVPFGTLFPAIHYLTHTIPSIINELRKILLIYKLHIKIINSFIYSQQISPINRNI